MLISTRGRYALRVLIDLAEQEKDTYVPMKEIATRQRISKKYMESIMVILSKNGLVDSVHGKGGGYRLNRPPKDYGVREILQLTEGTLAPVSCLECGAEPCIHREECRTVKLWEGLDAAIGTYLDGVSVADLMRQP